MTSSLQHLSSLQQMRLQLLASPFFQPPPGHPTPAAVKTLHSVTKFVRAIGKTYVALLHIDPKGFVDVPGSVQAVGWWWGEVGAAVKEGVVPKDGGSRAAGLWRWRTQVNFLNFFGTDDATVRYPKRFLLVGMTLFKNILSVLSTEQSHSQSFSLPGAASDPDGMVLSDSLQRCLYRRGFQSDRGPLAAPHRVGLGAVARRPRGVVRAGRGHHGRWLDIRVQGGPSSLSVFAHGADPGSLSLSPSVL